MNAWFKSKRKSLLKAGDWLKESRGGWGVAKMVSAFSATWQHPYHREMKTLKTKPNLKFLSRMKWSIIGSNPIKVIDFLRLESINKFYLFWAGFGWYDSTNKKSIILISFKLSINYFIRAKIFHTFILKNLIRENYKWIKLWLIFFPTVRPILFKKIWAKNIDCINGVHISNKYLKGQLL